MPDDYENRVGLDPLLNDANNDTDADGVSNIREYDAGTNPLNPDYPQLSQNVSSLFTLSTRLLVLDTDGDTIPDDWEITQGTDRFRNDISDDPDADGLPNIEEYNSGTEPNSNDSPAVSIGLSPIFAASTSLYPFPLNTDADDDGMPDWWEQRYGLDRLTNEASADMDGDGIVNLAEFHEGRSPIFNETITEVASLPAAFTLDTSQRPLDSDGDGLPDAWETAHSLDPFVNDADADADGDGRTNQEEYNAGTDPLIDDWRGPTSAISAIFLTDTGGFDGPRTRDTDGDGMPDWWEIQYGLDKDVSDAIADADADGISNLDEFNSGSNPTVQDRPAIIGISGVFLVDTGGRSFDTDADGIPDWWEKLYFNDPRAADPLADTDGDSQLNGAEFAAGSNPHDQNSVFRITGVYALAQLTGNTVTLRWASFEGSTYSIWAATRAEGPYALTATNIAATPPLNIFTFTQAHPTAFFRITTSR